MKVAAFLLPFTLILCFFPSSLTRADDAARFARHVALAAELEAEGASDEAKIVLAELEAPLPASTPAKDGEKAEEPVEAATRGGIGGCLARGVVLFYRTFVGPAIGTRCALEPSCSRYFVEASRKHGLLGIPMVADRFVREPVVSAPDRPWVKTPSGQLRHPDPVSDHDWWFR